MHLPTKLHHPMFVYSFGSHRVDMTNKQTHKQTPLKTSNALRYATTLGKSQTPLIRFVVDLLWICCGLVVQLVVQQIHNKSNKWSLTLIKETPAADRQKYPAPRLGHGPIITWSKILYHASSDPFLSVTITNSLSVSERGPCSNVRYLGHVVALNKLLTPVCLCHQAGYRNLVPAKRLVYFSYLLDVSTAVNSCAQTIILN